MAVNADQLYALAPFLDVSKLRAQVGFTGPANDFISVLISAVSEDAPIDFSSSMVPSALERLNVKEGTLVVMKSCKTRLQEEGDEALATRREQLADISRFVNMSTEAGCPMSIDPLVIAAVKLAQAKVQRQPTWAIPAQSWSINYTGRRFAIFPEYSIPKTTIAGENGQKVDFHGPLDYLVMTIDARDQAALTTGYVMTEISAAVMLIVETKSGTTFVGAAPQIQAQCFTLRQLTGRTVFAGVLCNGALWRFFVANCGQDKALTIYASSQLQQATDAGLIVGLLADLMIHQGTLAPSFRLEEAWSGPQVTVDDETL